MAEDGESKLRAGAQFGRYKLLRKIGRGGMGAVFEAEHTELKKRVALKALLPPATENEALRQRFLREGQAASRIRHAHIVDIYDVGEESGLPFLVMELLQGEDLSALLKRQRVLSPAEAVEILLPVVSALSAAHEEGIIHRDVKPANVFLTRDRYGELIPKVLDFGISKQLDESLHEGLTQTGAVMGTPFYMSPEQALGGRVVTAASDQYSLGVILYQALTGKRPFDADSIYSVLHSIVQGDFERPCLVHPEMPPELEAIVLRAMAKKPADRFPSVHALGVALFSYAEPAVRARWARAFDAGALEQATTRLTEVTVHPDSGQALATDPGKLVPQDLGAADVGERGWDEATRTRAKRPEGEDTQARESSLLREPVEPLAHTLARPEGVSSVELTQRGRPWAMAGALSLLALAATALGAALWLGSRPPVEVPVLEPEPVLSTRTASTTPLARPVPRAPPSAAAASGSVEAPPPALPRPAELPSTGPDRSEPLEPAAPERTRPRRPRPKGPIERGNNEAPILE